MKYLIIAVLLVGIFIPCLLAERNFDDLYAQKKDVLEKIFNNLDQESSDKRIEFLSLSSHRLLKTDDFCFF